VQPAATIRGPAAALTTRGRTGSSSWIIGLAHRLQHCFSMQGRAAMTMIRDSDWLYAAITIP
jgi:hypothetical protein